MKGETFGIIGFGKMGKLFAEIFKESYRIGVYSKESCTTQFEKFESFRSLFRFSDHLLIAVPSSEIENILTQLSDFKSEERKIIFDISTFKNDFIEAYTDLPDNFLVASVHPMFGEGAETLQDKNVIVIPVEGRREEAHQVERLFRRFGASVSIMDVEKHDEMMKIMIGLPYFFGISYLKKISEFENIEKYGGTSFKFISTYGKAVLNDSPEFIEEVIDKSSDEIEKFMENTEMDIEDIEDLKETYDSEIEKSYSKLYENL